MECCCLGRRVSRHGRGGSGGDGRLRRLLSSLVGRAGEGGDASGVVVCRVKSPQESAGRNGLAWPGLPLSLMPSSASRWACGMGPRHCGADVAEEDCAGGGKEEQEEQDEQDE